MPTYDYVCEACGHEFEHFQSMSDPLLKKCPVCKKARLVRKIGAGAGVIFKGSGFYQTDYKSKPKSDAASKPSEPSPKASESSPKGGASSDASSGSTTSAGCGKPGCGAADAPKSGGSGKGGGCASE